MTAERRMAAGTVKTCGELGIAASLVALSLQFPLLRCHSWWAVGEGARVSSRAEAGLGGVVAKILAVLCLVARLKNDI